ncbi:MAG TPA: hypothetical protein VMI72_11965 [Roseiarcus sp.]|nr:hypothetical protein [Roseiarcus sp.]
MSFEPVQVKKGKGWRVRVLFPHGPQPQIDGFFRRAEAVAWIEHESAAWLKQYEDENIPK